MISDTIKTSESKMNKSIEAFKHELAKIRTGRAHPSLLEHLHVSCYGSDMPLNQVASVTISDARTLVVTPWDKSMVTPIEKAIIQSGLGLNPATAGQVIRIPLPPLTEERRKEIAKLVRAEAENAKVSVRNIRRDANEHIKSLLKNKSISEDEERSAEETIQKVTNKFIAEIDRALASKEEEIMKV